MSRQVLETGCTKGHLKKIHCKSASGHQNRAQNLQ